MLIMIFAESKVDFRKKFVAYKTIATKHECPEDNGHGLKRQWKEERK